MNTFRIDVAFFLLLSELAVPHLSFFFASRLIISDVVLSCCNSWSSWPIIQLPFSLKEKAIYNVLLIIPARVKGLLNGKTNPALASFYLFYFTFICILFFFLPCHLIHLSLPFVSHVQWGEISIWEFIFYLIYLCITGCVFSKDITHIISWGGGRVCICRHYQRSALTKKTLK